jgi:hypothetical protein
MDGMEAIFVYAFEYFNQSSGQWQRGPVPATLAAISRYGWRAIPGTARQMFDSAIAANGVAFRWPSG